MRGRAMFYTRVLFLLLCGVVVKSYAGNPVFIPDRSFMTYTIVHPLHTFEATSKEVGYTLTLDSTETRISTVSGTVDVTTFDSGNSNRDSHAMEVVDAITYPEASFTGSDFSRQGDSLTVRGKLTLHGVTREVTSHGTAVWSGNELDVQENFVINMTEYGIERPSLLMMPVEDAVRFTMKAVFRKQ
jgi:polyisoprenoid-binding protein YceI